MNIRLYDCTAGQTWKGSDHVLAIFQVLALHEAPSTRDHFGDQKQYTFTKGGRKSSEESRAPQVVDMSYITFI